MCDIKEIAGIYSAKVFDVGAVLGSSIIKSSRFPVQDKLDSGASAKFSENLSKLCKSPGPGLCRWRLQSINSVIYDALWQFYCTHLAQNTKI